MSIYLVWGWVEGEGGSWWKISFPEHLLHCNKAQVTFVSKMHPNRVMHIGKITKFYSSLFILAPFPLLRKNLFEFSLLSLVSFLPRPSTQHSPVFCEITFSFSLCSPIFFVSMTAKLWFWSSLMWLSDSNVEESLCSMPFHRLLTLKITFSPSSLLLPSWILEFKINLFLEAVISSCIDLFFP